MGSIAPILCLALGLASRVNAAEDAKEGVPLAAVCEGIRNAPDAVARLRAIRKAIHEGPEAFLGLDVETLSTLAPDLLRVYDLSEALRDGEDAPSAPPIAQDLDHGALLDPIRSPDEPPARSSRGARMAAAVEEALRDAAGPGEGSLPATAFRPAGGDVLVVWGTPAQFEVVERTLQRVATTGGPCVPVEVTVTRNEAPGDVVARYALFVPWNRTVTAWRRVRHGYALATPVDDGPVAQGKGPRAPLVGAWGEGLSVTASAHGDPAAPRVTLHATVDFAIDPVPDAPPAGRATPAGVRLAEGVQRVFQMGFVVPPEGARATTPLFDGRLTLSAVARGALAEEPLGRGVRRLGVSATADATSIAKVDGATKVGSALLRFTLQGLGATNGVRGEPVDHHILITQSQSNSMTVAWPVSYISGMEVERHGERVIVDPVISTLGEGMRLEASYRPHPNGGLVLEGSVLVQRLDRPLATRALEFGVGRPVTVHLPVLREASRPFRVSLREGETVELPAPQFPGAPELTLRITLVRIGVDR